MKTMLNLVASILVLVCVTGRATPAGKSELELETEKIIVFKDGYALFVRSGTAETDDEGRVFLHEVPDSAVLGSFWCTTPDGPPITMRAGWNTCTNTVDVAVPCAERTEMLKANKGKACSLLYSDGKTHQGVILEVLTTDVTASMTEDQVASLMQSLSPTSRNTTRTISGVSGSHFVLRTQDGDELLAISAVQTLRVRDMETSLTRTVTEKVRRKELELRFKKAGRKQEVTLMYFRPGIRWIPTYRVALTGQHKKMARLALQAELLNEAEDLHDVPVDIVVGVPNFRFRELPSPLVLESVLRNTLQQSMPQLMNSNGVFSNAMFTQRSSEQVRDVLPSSWAGSGAPINLPEELSAVGKQDLFVYHLPKLTLAKGERGTAHIFEAEVPYRDVYTWDLQIKRHDIATAPSGSGVVSPLILSQNQVWHQVELSNVTQVPWTTGAAMIMQELQPLAQELLTYTSPGGVVRVPVTVSVDTRGSYEEEETERQLKALVWDHNHYTKISNRATLSLANHKKEPVNAEITLRFGGRGEEASDGGKITLAPYRGEDWQNYRGSPAVNNSTVVTWSTTVKPGERFAPSVRYHYLARH